MKQRLAILGSSGSIGSQTLDIAYQNPSLFEVTTLTCNSSWEVLAAQARKFLPDNVVIADKSYYAQLKDALQDLPIKVYAGEDALCQVSAATNVDTVVAAMVGYAGLEPALAAIKAGKKIALANKESLVVAGGLFMELSKKYNAPIIPVDSEHSAIFQCLVGEQSQISKLILTASGGPFYKRDLESFDSITKAEALRHPNWSMGSKITIDSATMMNKGFEVIEAHWLFGTMAKDIEVVIHPQSVIHSMVEFGDGAIKAQLGTPDMHLPIQYALSFPKRLPLGGDRLDFKTLGSLDFYEVDYERFPCLRMAYECLEQAGNSTTILNAANEVAVEQFLKERISYNSIYKVIEKTLERCEFCAEQSMDNYRNSDARARQIANEIIKKYNIWKP